MSKFEALLEAVDKLKETESDYLTIRSEVATLLKELSRTESITNLSRLTKINRSTIYWLIKTWSNSANGNSRNNAA